MGFLAKLDTNGTNPGMLEQIVKAGLVNYVAMDIKNAPSKYALTAGIPQTQAEDSLTVRMQKNIQKSISSAWQSGLRAPAPGICSSSSLQSAWSASQAAVNA